MTRKSTQKTEPVLCWPVILCYHITMRETITLIRQGVTATVVGLVFVITVLSSAHTPAPSITFAPHDCTPSVHSCWK